MSSDEPFEMRIVSTTSESALNLAHSRDALVWPLREMSANLIRVVRGAGRPEELGRQMVGVVLAFQSYREVVGAYPSNDDIRRAIALPVLREEREQYGGALTSAVDVIVRGGLQMAASRLVGQLTQASAGESEIFNGITRIERARAAIRRENAPAPQRKTQKSSDLK